jgi:hypothetical protein
MYLRALERQQEPDAMNQTQQAYTPERGGHDDQQVNEQIKMSKTLAKEKNRLKTQEGQMINVSLHSFSSYILHDHHLRVENT